MIINDVYNHNVKGVSMKKKCTYCSKMLDTEHDSYYYCKCDGKRKVVCKHCAMNHDKCPVCGKGLQHHSESITKKVFFNPATRNGLGF